MFNIWCLNPSEQKFIFQEKEVIKTGTSLESRPGEMVKMLCRTLLSPARAVVIQSFYPVPPSSFPPLLSCLSAAAAGVCVCVCVCRVA